MLSLKNSHAFAEIYSTGQVHSTLSASSYTFLYTCMTHGSSSAQPKQQQLDLLPILANRSCNVCQSPIPMFPMQGESGWVPRREVSKVVNVMSSESLTRYVSYLFYSRVRSIVRWNAVLREARRFPPLRSWHWATAAVKKVRERLQKRTIFFIAQWR